MLDIDIELTYFKPKIKLDPKFFEGSRLSENYKDNVTSITLLLNEEKTEPCFSRSSKLYNYWTNENLRELKMAFLLTVKCLSVKQGLGMLSLNLLCSASYVVILFKKG